MSSEADTSEKSVAGETKDRKKKHEHEHKKKKSAAAPPPDLSVDGGFESRIHGVPGSTPGCTAGAYATPLSAEGLPEITLKTCFPEHYAAGKKWLSECKPKSLGLLVTKFGPTPSVADIVNKWLIRRVGRKCAEGTEEGRADMAAFALDAVRRLRKLPACSATLYRAVPWRSMGKSAPGTSEFCEESNIVWPTFTSLTRNEARAREMLKDEGGFLYVVEATQARDVSAFAPFAPSEPEYMLEPNSEFTITFNEQQGSVFVVGMRQNHPSMRPIAGDIDLHSHRHRRASVAVDGEGAQPPAPSATQPGTSPAGTGAPQLPPTPATGTVTPLVRRPPVASPTSAPRTPSVSAAFGAPGSTPTTPLASSTRAYRLSLPSTPRTVKRTAPRPPRRLPPSTHSPMTITMWSAARAYIKVLSAHERGAGHAVATPAKPEWTAAPVVPSSEDGGDAGAAAAAAPVEAESVPVEAESTPVAEEEEASAEAAGQSVEWLAAVAPPQQQQNAPGYGTMLLFPNAAPSAIIDKTAQDFVSLGGIVLNRKRVNQAMVMSLNH